MKVGIWKTHKECNVCICETKTEHEFVFLNEISAAKKIWVGNIWDKRNSQASIVLMLVGYNRYTRVVSTSILWVQCLVFGFRWRGSDPARCLGPDLTLSWNRKDIGIGRCFAPYQGLNGQSKAWDYSFGNRTSKCVFFLLFWCISRDTYYSDCLKTHQSHQSHWPTCVNIISETEKEPTNSGS